MVGVASVFFYKSNLLLSISALKFNIFFFPAVKNKYFSKTMLCVCNVSMSFCNVTRFIPSSAAFIFALLLESDCCAKPPPAHPKDSQRG